MAEFPLDPMLSKTVIAAEKYGCVEEVSIRWKMTTALRVAGGFSLGSDDMYHFLGSTPLRWNTRSCRDEDRI